MIGFISYFIVPTAVFLTLVKLNNKQRWLTARIRSSDYWTKNGKSIDKVFFWMLVFFSFLLWWIFIPVMVIVLAVSKIINWITNGEGAIPVNKEDSRYRY